MFRKAIERMMADMELGLRKYELTKEEWELIVQLTEVLKVFVTD